MDEYMKTIEEQRRTFRDAFRSNSSEKDKIVVSVSASALGVSIAFLSDSGPGAGWKWVLVLAWAAFGIALVSVLLTFHVNSLQIQRSIGYIDAWKETKDGDRPKDGGYKFWKSDVRMTDAFDALSVFSLIAGVGLMVLFVSLNL